MAAVPQRAQTSDTDSVKEHMYRLKMKMVQQKLQNEKDRIVNRPSSEASTSNDLENQARLQQAMLRRQELLDKIRREQLLNDESKRPRTHSARRRYTPSPLLAPPSRRSLPDFAKYHIYNQMPDTYRSKPDVRQVKHVIQHQVPQHTTNLPPINQPRPQPVIVHQPPPPQVVLPMQQPAPQIIAAPGPQHIITGFPPNPVITNLAQPDKKAGMFNKEDFGEMMMMQNAQMHQMVMQKLMLGNLGRQEYYDHHPDHHGGGCHDCHSGCCSSHGVHGSCGHGSCGHGHGGHWGHGGCFDCYPAVPRVNGAVHHHHYSNPPSQPAPQPAVTHYTTVPAMDIRGGYPGYGGEFMSGGYYTDSYAPSYEYYI